MHVDGQPTESVGDRQSWRVDFVFDPLEADVIYLADAVQGLFKTKLCMARRADLDCSGKVDRGDLEVAAASWSTSCDNPNPDSDPDTADYDPFYDLTGGCRVGVGDLTYIASMFEP